jgi:integrase
MTTRFQTGSIYEAYGAFHIKYYTTVLREGKEVRVQRSHKLCRKDDEHYSATCKKVKKLASDYMVGINAKDGTVENPDSMTVAKFFEGRYIKYCEEVSQRTGRPRQRPNTVAGHWQIWKRNLKAHFGSTTLVAYEAVLGNRFLKTLTATQGKTTIKHVRSLGSSIFKLAVSDELIKTNPWRDVQVPEDAEQGDDTAHYTLSEVEDLISALVDHVDCQLVLSLACYLGLRPGEVAALKWADIEGDWLHVQRSVVRGDVDRPKTRESIAKLPIVDAVRVPLELWREKSMPKAETAGWVFPSSNDTPVDLHNMIARVIMPHLEGKRKCVLCKKVPNVTKEVKWKGLYAGRRSAATNVIEQTGGDFAVAQQLLRHKSATTTLTFYKKLMTPKTFQERMERAFPAPKQLES